jgi:hypothetical protein
VETSRLINYMLKTKCWCLFETKELVYFGTYVARNWALNWKMMAFWQFRFCLSMISVELCRRVAAKHELPRALESLYNRVTGRILVQNLWMIRDVPLKRFAVSWPRNFQPLWNPKTLHCLYWLALDTTWRPFNSINIYIRYIPFLKALS